MKKIGVNILFIITILGIYYLQSNFFNWFTIAGVMPNIFVIFIVFVGLFTNKYTGVIYGIIVGVILDTLLGQVVGINMIAYSLVAILAIVFDKNFSKDSRATITVMIIAATLIFEVVSIICSYIILHINVDLWIFIKTLLIETIFNLIITIIIYPLFQNVGEIVENEYKGSQVLTRYF